MTNNKFVLSIAVFILLFSITNAQKKLTPQEAINLALEHNYGIKVAKNNTLSAENNANLLNSGYLPRLSANADGTYNIDDIEANFTNGNQRVLNNATSSRYSAGLTVNYTLFDGLGRKYNYKQLKETKNLSELETREIIENTILQMFSVYFSLAETLENKTVLEKTLEISKERLLRAQYQYEYGQNTKLEILNAQVDTNKDTINLMNIHQLLNSYKRDLNLVLGTTTKSNSAYDIDTTLSFNTLYNKNELTQKAIRNNVTILKAESNILLANYNVKSNQSNFLPNLNLTGNYGWNRSNNNSAAFVANSTNIGFTGGITLSWDLFNGNNIINKKNAKLNLTNQKLKKEELLVTVKRNFSNAWDDFQNKLNIYQLQNQNITTAQDNFNRTKEKFKLGKVNSIAFRQAQLNLINVSLEKNKAKYQAKLAELKMLQACGEILNVQF